MLKLPNTYSKELKKEYYKWNRILKKSGFIDIEYSQTHFNDNTHNAVRKMIEEEEVIPKVHTQNRQSFFWGLIDSNHSLIANLSNNERDSLFELFVDREKAKNYDKELVKLKVKLDGLFLKIYKGKKHD